MERDAFATLERLYGLFGHPASEDLGRLEDALTIRSILGAVALAKGALELSAWIGSADESEIEEMLEVEAALSIACA
jgi:hypothetical protein